jgi:hypothetical protein|eukprot:TRINITY_DN63227_c0_g1_i1.p1 TRINITY_DN63227_c0_g1~~TRINITY_DN63227_c0_g1_i1.p1  ORF type:complete len:331 (-),score=48.63 TRINITY_DN63227_c0_g1_i1:134-1126(-)
MGCCYGTPSITSCEHDFEPGIHLHFPEAGKKEESFVAPVPVASPVPNQQKCTGASPAEETSVVAQHVVCRSVALPAQVARANVVAQNSAKVAGGVALSFASDLSSNDRRSGSAAPSVAPRQLLAGTRDGTSLSSSFGRQSRGLRPHSAAPELVRLQYRELTPEDYELLCLLDEALPKVGRTPLSAVSRLPCMIARDCIASECHVCLSDFLPHAQVTRLPCQHVFHHECISRWLTQCSGKCPLCMAPIECMADSDAVKTASAVSSAIQNCGVADECVLKTQQVSCSERLPAARCDVNCGRLTSRRQLLQDNSLLFVAGENELHAIEGPGAE